MKQVRRKANVGACLVDNIQTGNGWVTRRDRDRPVKMPVVDRLGGWGQQVGVRKRS